MIEAQLNLKCILIIVLICVSVASTNAQNANNTFPTSRESNQTFTASITITSQPGNDTVDDESNEAKESILLSKEEFVDFTEAPTLLFDSANSTSEETNSTLTGSSSPSDASSTSAPETTTTLKDDPTEERSTSPSSLGTNATRAEEPNSTSAPEMASAPPVSHDDPSTGMAEDEDEGEGNEDSDQDDSRDISKQFEPPKNISQYMDYIETLFHDLRHQITDLFEPHIPQLIRTSQMVQLSGSCSYDMLRLALALRQFEPWALRLIDSSGKVPEGIFEGSFTALGSYDECISTVFASSSSSSSSSSSTSMPSASTSTTANERSPTQGKYCLVSVSPFMPPKPPADTIERLFQEEANKRNYTKVSV